MAEIKYTIDDFEIGIQIGEGSFSIVYKAKFVENGKECALKKLESKSIIKENLTKSVFREREILLALNHPNIIGLYGTFRSSGQLYFVIELAKYKLTDAMKKYGSFTPESARFYTAEVVSALEYMHSMKIIHRDIKPENILLTEDMHIKLTDFGASKILRDDNEKKCVEDDDIRVRKTTFVGSANTIAPELLSSNICYLSSDLWALGVILFWLLTGKYPFQAASEYLMFQKIKKRQFRFPGSFPDDARDLCNSLMVLDPKKRLGANGYDELKSHSFFKGIDFEKLSTQRPPNITPEIIEKQKRISLSKEFEQWAKYLLKNEEIIFTTPIIKRRHLSVKRRQLILTNRPRLVYVDPIKQCQKGSIPLTNELAMVKKSEKKFLIKVPGRSYDIEVEDNDFVEKWIRHISRCTLK